MWPPPCPLTDAAVRSLTPGAEKKAAEAQASPAAASSFGAVGNDYLEKAAKEGREAVTIKKSWWLLALFDSTFQARPPNDITAAELYAALKVIEAKRHHEAARRMRSLAGRIFRYGVATGRATSEAVVEAMERRLDRRPEAMRIRRQTVEHPFGTLKS